MTNIWKLLFAAVFSMSAVAAYACGGDGDDEVCPETPVEVSAEPAPSDCGCGH